MDNDIRHTAIHEAGHAVIGRVLGMICDYVTVEPDHDSAGHSITADPLAILHAWERRGRFRDAKTCFRGRIMTLMAGAEAEIALLGECEGGDGEDRYQVGLMLWEVADGDDDAERQERRLRRATSALCRRHRSKIEALASVLLDRKTIEDDEVWTLTGIARPVEVDYWGLQE